MSAQNWNERIHKPVPVKLWIRPGRGGHGHDQRDRRDARGRTDSI